MPLANYGELKTAISEYLDRANDATFVARIPTFVSLFESTFNAKQRLRRMEASATLTLAGGYAALPSDFLSVRNVTTNDAVPRNVSLITPEYAATLATGMNQPFYYVRGTNIYSPVTGASLILNYYQKLTALSADADTNWLLTNFPKAYLYGTLLESQPYTEDDSGTQRWAGLYALALDDLQRDDESARWTNAAIRKQGPNP